MRLLYGTSNPAKLSAMRRALEPLGIELLGLRDMEDRPPDVPETGRTPLENARQKAWAYFQHYKMPVFSCDSGLHLAGVPDALQPGAHVRARNGAYMTDDEMIAYYSGLARTYGELTAWYDNAVCLIRDEARAWEAMDESLASEKFLLAAQPHAVRRKGFPLDSLSKEIRSGAYYYDLSGGRETDALVAYQGFVAFFRAHLEELE